MFSGDGSYPYAAQRLALGAEGAKATNKYGEKHVKCEKQSHLMEQLVTNQGDLLKTIKTKLKGLRSRFKQRLPHLAFDLFGLLSRYSVRTGCAYYCAMLHKFV